MSRHHALAVLALFLVATAWGASFTIIKDVLRLIAPEPYIFWRFTLAGGALVVAALATRQLPRRALRPGLILGTLVFIGYWAQTRGLLTISPSRSAFLTGIYVVMVPFADRVVCGRRIAARAWIASVLAVIGTTLLIGGIDARPGFGDALTLICAVCFALHVVLTAGYSASTPALGLAGVQVLVVGIGAAPLTLFARRTPMTREVAAVIVATALVTTALAFVALMWGQARVTATEAAVILAFEPVAASITSIVYEHEPITRGFVFGASFILAAMVLSQLPEPSRRDPLQP